MDVESDVPAVLRDDSHVEQTEPDLLSFDSQCECSTSVFARTTDADNVYFLFLFVGVLLTLLTTKREQLASVRGD